MRKDSSRNSEIKAFGADQTVIAPSIGSSEFFPSQYLYKEAYNNFRSQLYAPAFETGYYDIFALSREYAEDPDFNLSFSNINTNYLFSIDNFKILGVVRGKINDEQKLSDLLENSIEKYSDSCYTTDNYF